MKINAESTKKMLVAFINSLSKAENLYFGLALEMTNNDIARFKSELETLDTVLMSDSRYNALIEAFTVINDARRANVTFAV